MTGYEADFVKWTEETARAILEGRWSDIDRAALADEVESLGKRDRKSVKSRLAVLLQHMLKAKYQPEKASRSWARTIFNQRLAIEDEFNYSPSLRAQMPELIAESYTMARRKAIYETALPDVTFPASCEWTVSEVLGA